MHVPGNEHRKLHFLRLELMGDMAKWDGWMDEWMGFLGSTGLRNNQGGPGPATGKKKDRLPKSSKKILMVQSWSFASAAQNQNPPIWG